MSTEQQLAQPQVKEDCFTCKIIGSAAFAGVGVYALQMSRARAPGSVVGKRIMGGVGVCEFFPVNRSWNQFMNVFRRLFSSKCSEMVQINLMNKVQNIIFRIRYHLRSNFVQ